MAQTALFIRPMARKKKVTQKYAPNSYRVISVQAETIEPPPVSTYTALMSEANVIGQPASQVHPNMDHRHNRPNPQHVGFLSQNVALLNEPICDVYTSVTKDAQDEWWPSRISTEPLKQAPHTLDTTFRDDFQFRGDKEKNTRHSSNPNKNPALGAVPVNFIRERSGKQRFWKEGISYEHQYNCREDPSYRIRAKRQGHFVWDRFADKEVDRMLQYYGYAVENGGQQGPINLNGNAHMSGVTSRHQTSAKNTYSGPEPEKLPSSPVKIAEKNESALKDTLVEMSTQQDSTTDRYPLKDTDRPVAMTTGLEQGTSLPPVDA